MLTQQKLLECLHYDKDTGIFTRLKITSNRVKVGDVAGTYSGKGYRTVTILGKRFYEHRLAWLYVTGQMPTDQIDHIDNNRSNNAFSNLRLANNSQNRANTGIRKHNTTGFKGVAYDDRKSRKWIAQISIAGKTTYLGAYDTPEEAHAAYCKKARLIHGEFARTS